MSSQYRCVDCGTPLVASTGLGHPPTEVVDGRPHTHGGCVEYLKAALSSARGEKRLLLAAAREARIVLALCTTCRSESPEDREVGYLGDCIGYGALISAASKMWAMKFDGTPQAGAHYTTGPCESTVQATLRQLDYALTIGESR